jgi:hypothetical protein
MPAVGNLWIEGEKIPDRRVKAIFRPPPELPSVFLRSSLLIGSRGAGKTTLFRYQEQIHQGVAIYVSLAEEFGPLAREMSYGPLAFDIPNHIESYLIGKATSLLAISIAEHLNHKGHTISIKRSSLAECLPEDFSPPKRSIDTQWLVKIKKALIRNTNIEAFNGIAESRPLPFFLADVGRTLESKSGPLLLLLDRADMVLPAALIPLVEVLDQSRQYTALVAMRPGHAGESLASVSETIIPGDNYGLEYLGTNPRSEEWIKFVEDAVRAQLGPVLDTIPKGIKRWIITVARDSLRTALELFARYISEKGMLALNELTTAMNDLREKQLAAAQRTLQNYHPDFRKLVHDLRAEALSNISHIKGPVFITIDRHESNELFDKSKRWSRFIDVGLRCGALCMPEGEHWSPGLQPNKLEVPPLLIWQKGDSFWTDNQNPTPAVIGMSRSMLRPGGGPQKPTSIFVAYRMRVDESIGFLNKLKSALRLNTKLHDLVVEDGRVPEGIKWAEKIRERISKTKVVIADVTGVSSEVFFELGFAYGLGKFEIRAVKDKVQISDLPHWIREVQIGHYGDDAGISGLVSSISVHLSDPSFNKGAKPPQPVLPLAVWLRNTDWNQQAHEQFQVVAERWGLKHETYDDGTSEETLIRRAASASLLVVSLDGTKADALMHYVCGAVAAKPRAGTYNRPLSREIIVLEDPKQAGAALVADSLKRCHHIARVIQLNQIRGQIEQFGQAYQQWATSSSKSSTKRRRK